MLRRIADWGHVRPSGNRGREFLAHRPLRWTVFRRGTVGLGSWLDVLAAQLGLEVLQHLRRERVALVPDLDHALQLIFLLRWNALECVVE